MKIERIHMLVFSQYFALNVHHLNDSIYIWNCCDQAQFLNKKTNKQTNIQTKKLT